MGDPFHGLPQNPICAPEAGWPSAAPEGQNASPGGLSPSNPSVENSKEPGFIPPKGRLLARMKSHEGCSLPNESRRRM
jgi:hypothetical protein